MDDHLLRLGLAPHVGDADLAQAYADTPAPEKGVVKNAVALAHAQWRGWAIPTERGLRLGSVTMHEVAQPMGYALFLYHPQRFPLPALAAALTLAVVARVAHLAVVAPGPWDRALLFACDFLSVPLLYRAEDLDLSRLHGALAEHAGPGQVVDLGLGGVATPLAFAPEDYAVVDTLPPSPQTTAYARILGPLRHTDPRCRPQWYLAYGDDAEVPARYRLAARLLGGWPWDRLSPEDFLLRTTSFA